MSLAESIKQPVSSGVESVEKSAHKSTPNVGQAQLADFTVDYTKDRGITTHFGVLQSGPTLIEDTHAREKITHFDHERIPERVVHARGTGAYGYCKLHTPILEVTYAPILNNTTLTTPTFLRFSIVQGFWGSADTVRDVRGFATRFYTQRGDWNIVANNNPFFIQEAIKFPDVIHAVKPDQAKEIPPARNMIHRFGIHSFVCVNPKGQRSFIKFHWKPKLEIHSLVWDEALKISGQDPDFHRRDLYDAIEAGSYPEYEFGVQVVPEEKEHDFEFDLTKIFPEELVPVRYIETMALNKCPDHFFAETVQIALCAQHMVPEIEHSNEPSFTCAPSHTKMQINKGPNHWLNRFGTLYSIPGKDGGQALSPQPLPGGVKERVRGPKFGEHYSQATLCWNSMLDVEQEHIVGPFSFELVQCDDKGVIELMLEQINFIDNKLACLVAQNLHLQTSKDVHPNHGKATKFPSQINPANSNNAFTAAGRRMALFVHDGFDFGITSGIKAAFVNVVVLANAKSTARDKEGGCTLLEKRFTQDRWCFGGEIDHLVDNLELEGAVAEQGMVPAGTQVTEAPMLIKMLKDEISKTFCH